MANANDRRRVDHDGRQYLVIGGEVFVRVGRKWSGAVLPSERAAVLAVVR